MVWRMTGPHQLRNSQWAGTSFLPRAPPPHQSHLNIAEKVIHQSMLAKQNKARCILQCVCSLTGIDMGDMPLMTVYAQYSVVGV